MSTKAKIGWTVLAFTIAGFLLNPNTPLGAAVWGHAEGDGSIAPTPMQLALLMGVVFVQSLGFGIGGAFLLYGFATARRLFPRGNQARIAHLAVSWGLLSWVPHSALHETAGANFDKLVAIEYSFHVTLVLAAAALAWLMMRAAGTFAPAIGERAPASPQARATVVRRVGP
jgi:hypothetical protein